MLFIALIFFCVCLFPFNFPLYHFFIDSWQVLDMFVYVYYIHEYVYFQLILMGNSAHYMFMNS